MMDPVNVQRIVESLATQAPFAAAVYFALAHKLNAISRRLEGHEQRLQRLEAHR